MVSRWSVKSTVREKNQGLDCANLLRLAKERGEERKCHCDRMVYEAVELLEDLLK